MKTWHPYNNTDFKHLNNNIEVKTYDGKVHSISIIVGSAVVKANGDKIDTDEIFCWRAKKDWSRYNKLQKHNEVLEQYDFEKLDEFEFAISDSYKNEEDKKKVEKLFKKLKKHIEAAQENVIKESKQFLL